MCEANLVLSVANLLRPASKEVARTKGKLCLSTVNLHKLNQALKEIFPGDLTSSFHRLETHTSMHADALFLRDLVKLTVALKISPDLLENEQCRVVDLHMFQNIKILEIHKIDVKNILGIQKMRAYIEELICTYSLDDLSDLLDKCGGDSSQRYNWSELKRLNISHNNIKEMDSIFESTPWLQVLDLSHNQIRNLEFIDHLSNLKRLNLSYNKLEKVPRFKGQIRKRLQVLLLNNNFIEDISGLATLSDVLQIDLAQNCLMDHNSLLSLSQMPSLHSLDLRGNPISFHPSHRTLTCNYLNKNTATLNFILDNIPLTKAEKSLAGTLYPLSQASLGCNGSYSSSQNSLENSVQDRPKKVRNVLIQEGHDIKPSKEQKKIESVTPSPRSTDRGHLDVKIKIEQLRKEYQEGWLSKASAEILQDLLKFPELSKVSTSTPLRGSPTSLNNDFVKQGCLGSDNYDSRGETTNDTFKSCVSNIGGNEEIKDDEDIVEADVYRFARDEPVEEVQSDDDDFDSGETFFGGTKPDSNDLCIIVTKTHLSERDSTTAKEKARWHMNIVKFSKPGQHPDEVRLEFDTHRSDRMARTYFVENADQFVKLMFDRIRENKIPDKRIIYSCLKCDYKFSRIRKVSTVMDEEDVCCPKCDSKLVHKDSDL